MNSTIVLMATDLLLGSRVSTAAKKAGMGVQRVRSSIQVEELASRDGAERPAALVADLTLPGAIEACRAWSALTQRPAVGFCPHVAVDLIRTAQAAGVERVLVHGQLESQLPILFEEVAKPQGDSGG